MLLRVWWATYYEETSSYGIFTLIVSHHDLTVVVDPGTIFTLELPGWSLDGLVYESCLGPVNLKLHEGTRKVTCEVKLLVTRPTVFHSHK